MKFFIINSFRTIVYVAYVAIILAGLLLGIYNANLEPDAFMGQAFGIEGGLAKFLDVVIGGFAGWLVASLVCGLIVTLLDIRDDINDRLPDARRDD